MGAKQQSRSAGVSERTRRIALTEAEPRQATPAARAEAARGGEGFVQQRRLVERFHVPGATITYTEPVCLGLWRRAHGPCAVWDLSVRGVSFETFGPELPAGTRVRLRVQLPNRLPFSVRAQVIWNKPPAAPTESAARLLPRLMAVEFVDYGLNAWATLCDAHMSHSSSAQLAGLRHTPPAAGRAAAASRAPEVSPAPA